jgi:hypothetical protein
MCQDPIIGEAIELCQPELNTGRAAQTACMTELHSPEPSMMPVLQAAGKFSASSHSCFFEFAEKEWIAAEVQLLR